MPVRVIESNRQLVEGACGVLEAGGRTKEKRNERGIIFLELCVQYDMSLLLGVRR